MALGVTVPVALMAGDVAVGMRAAGMALGVTVQVALTVGDVAVGMTTAANAAAAAAESAAVHGTTGRSRVSRSARGRSVFGCLRCGRAPGSSWGKL